MVTRHEIIRTWMRGGEEAARPLLVEYIPECSTEDLRPLVAEMMFLNLYGLAFAALPVLLRRLAAGGDPEREAYSRNDLGIALMRCGDDRALGCFRRALALTKQAGRRMRTMGRLAEHHLIVRRDWERAAKFYRAAIVIGDRAGYNPLHVEQARMRLREIERDRRGESGELDGLRAETARAARVYRDALAVLEMP
jgi:hypothetical protein